MVEAILAEEEGLGVARVFRATPGKHHHVAAGAEAAPPGMVDNHDLYRRILAPGEQDLAHGVAHLAGQRVNRLGAVEAESPDVTVDRNQDVVGHWRSMSRLTIIRMT